MPENAGVIEGDGRWIGRRARLALLVFQGEGRRIVRQKELLAPVEFPEIRGTDVSCIGCSVGGYLIKSKGF